MTNGILEPENGIGSMTNDNRDPVGAVEQLAASTSVVGDLAARSSAARTASYVEEIQGLLDAGLAVMQRLGTTATPRISDIVADAGMSNDAVYRHFTGKDDLLAAAIESGVEQLVRYLASEMAAAGDDPAHQLARWVSAMLEQASDPDRAERMRIVMWNAYRVNDSSRRNGIGREAIARLLISPLADLGSSDPERNSLMVAYSCSLRLEEFLWHNDVPSDEDINHAIEFCLRAAGVSEGAADRSTAASSHPTKEQSK